jgi:hypothetical protein
MLTRSVSANKAQINIVRKTIAAIRSEKDTFADGNFASGVSDRAISLAPPGSHGSHPIHHRRRA